jgi:hypothetical protein
MITVHHLCWRLFRIEIRSWRFGRETETRPSREIAMQARRRADQDLGIR